MTTVEAVNAITFAPPHHGNLAAIAYRPGRESVEVAVGLTEPGDVGEEVWAEPWREKLDEAEIAELRERVLERARRLIDDAELDA